MAWRPVDLDPLVLVMVGKPARGKTFTARRVARYLVWLGYRARVFNAGAYRRRRLGAGQPASFYDPDNEQGVAARERIAQDTVEDMLVWLRAGGEVGVFDATNGQRARRAWVRKACEDAGARVLFVELVNESADAIARNVRETKARSLDYADRSVDEAVRDFMQRIEAYDRRWEPLSREEGDHIRLIDGARRIEAEGIDGYLPGRLATFLLHLHPGRRCVLLTRHGQSRFNQEGRLGGDADLAPAGQVYAERLQRWLEEEASDLPSLGVWTSTLRRTIQTAQSLPFPQRRWKLLDEIDAGVCDGMTYAEIADQLPEVASARQADKFGYRYPQGESYQDLVDRLDPVVLELERRETPVLIVAHQAVLRVLYGYLSGTHPQRIPHLSVPLHTVLRVTPGAYGTNEEPVPLGPTVDPG